MTLHQLFDFLIPEERRPLGLLILLSLVIHVGAFFVFKSPPYYPKAIKAAAPKATLLQLSSAGANGRVSAWVDLFDPSVIALPSKEPHTSTVEELSPHFNDAWPILESPVPLIPTHTELPILPDSLPPLAERASESIQPSTAQPMSVAIETPPVLRGTDLQFSNGLAKREVSHRETLPQVKSTLTLLRPTALRVAVDAQGVVAYAMIDESCGDSTVDLLAVQALKNWRFAETESQKALQWGRATVFWDIQPPSSDAKPETAAKTP